MTRVRTAAIVAALVLAASARPQGRPSEEEMFGGPAPERPGRAEVVRPGEAGEPPGEDAGRGAAPSAGADSSPRPEEAELFGAQGAPNALPPPPEGIVSKDRDDPLRLGGQLYLRAATTVAGRWRLETPTARDAGDEREGWLSSPNLLDLYLDARPNERVRAFVLGRMSYDPTLDGEVDEPTLPELLGAGAPENPHAVLDQLWVNFDVGRRLFVTAGKQHVKWGVGRFWNPTDYLHASRRDPVAVFDPRTGTAMVKLHAPWEARGWNAYGVLVLEDTGARRIATRRIEQVGTGGRVEFVVGTLEMGLDALVRDGRRPRLGADVSLGVWELDLYAEAALRTGAEVERWRRVPGSLAPLGLERIRYDGPTPHVVAGATWARKYSDQDLFTVGVEYSYDRTGYTDPDVYPYLIAVPYVLPGEPSPFTPFYLARHQAGIFATLPAPGRWNDTTFTLSALGNLSDRSFLVRLDHSVLALTYLRVETYVAAHLGTSGGELRFGIDEDPSALGIPVPAGARLVVPPAVLDIGVALRVAL